MINLDKLERYVHTEIKRESPIACLDPQYVLALIRIARAATNTLRNIPRTIDDAKRLEKLREALKGTE